MPRRWIVTLTFITLLVVLVALAPGTAWVRHAALERVQTEVGALGLDIEHGDTRGNLWTGIRVEDLVVRQGASVTTVSSADLRWNLWQAISGPVPLWVDLDGVTADLDLQSAPLTLSGASPDVPFIVRSLHVSDLRLGTSGDAWSLASLGIRGVTIDGDADAWRVSGDLTSDTVRVPFEALVRPSEPSVQVDVADGDARVLQSLWPALEEGRWAGSLQWSPDSGAVGHVDLSDVSASVPTNLEPVAMTDASARLEFASNAGAFTVMANALGGRTAVEGTFDLATRTWSAGATGEADFEEIASWLGLETSDSAQGDVTFSLTGSGWDSWRVEGEATGDGLINGRVARLDLNSIALDASGTLDLEGRGELLGGQIVIRSEEALLIALRDASWGPLSDLSLDADVRTNLPLEGTAEVAGLVAGGPLEGAFLASVDLTPRGLRSTVEGDLVGNAVEGFLVSEEGRVNARLQLATRAASQHELVVSARGTWADLELALSIAGDTPLSPTWAGAQLDADLRGAASGRITNLETLALEGAFGPVTFAGSLPLTTTQASSTLAFSVEETAFRVGDLSALLSLQDGGIEASIDTHANTSTPSRTWSITANGLSATANDASVEIDLDGFLLPITQANLGRANGELEGQIIWNEASSWTASGQWIPNDAILGTEPIVVQDIQLGSEPRADLRRGPLTVRWSPALTRAELLRGDLGLVWPTLAGWQGEGSISTASPLPATPVTDIEWFGSVSVTHAEHGSGDATLDGDTWLVRANASAFEAGIETRVLWMDLPRITASVTLPGDVTARIDVSASQRDVLRGGTWRGEAEVEAAGAPGYGMASSPLELTLAGDALRVRALEEATIQLRTDGVQGQIVLPLLVADEAERTSLAVNGPWSAPSFEITTDDLSLSGRLASGQLDALRVEGSGRTVAGVTLSPGPSGLAWSQTEGWQGAAELALAAPLVVSGVPTPNPQDLISMQLTGDREGLRLAAEARTAAETWDVGVTLDARAQGAPWSVTWSGTGDLTARVRDAAQETILAVASSLSLTGQGWLPSLTGSGFVRGAVEGELIVSSDSLSASVAVVGTGTDLTGRITPEGWNLSGALSGIDLSRWLAWAPEATLRAEPSLQGDWAGGVEGTLAEMRLHTSVGTWTGEGTVADAIRLQGDVELELAALTQSIVQGAMAGPLGVTAPFHDVAAAAVTAQLTTRNVDAFDSAWRGSVAVHGPWSTLDAELSLTAQGAWTGTLELQRTPSSATWSAASTLQGSTPLGEFTSNLRAEGGPRAASAEGFILIGSTLLEASGTNEASVLLRDTRQAGGTELELANLLDTPILEGRILLASLVPAVEGRADVTAQWRNANEPWLAAEVSPLTAWGATLPTQRITITSTQLEGLLSGTPNGYWQLSRGDGAWTAYASGIALGGAAQGYGLDEASWTASSAGNDARVRFATPAGPIEADGFSQAGVVTLAITSTLREGAIHGRIDRIDGSWQGEVTANDLDLPILGRVTAVAQAQGLATWPELLVTSTLDGPADAQAQLTLTPAPEGWTVSADATVFPTSDEPIALSGRLWPDLTLSIVTPRSQATLSAGAWNAASPLELDGILERNQQGIITRLAPEPNGDLELRAFALATPTSGLRLTLPAQPLRDTIDQVWNEGIRAEGYGQMEGQIQLDRTGVQIADALHWDAPFGRLTAQGAWLEGEASLNGTVQGDASTDATLAARFLTSLTGDEGLDWNLTGTLEQADLTFEPRTPDATLLRGAATLQAEPLSLTVDARAAGSVLNVRADAGNGLRGTWSLVDLAFSLPGDLPTVVQGDITFEGSLLRADLRATGPGRASLDGVLDVQQFLPAVLRPDTFGASTNASARITGFDLAAIPWIAREIPHLSGTLNGLAELRGTRVLSQLSIADLTTAGREVPLRIDAAGDLSAGADGVSFVGRWGGDPIQGTIDRDAVSVLLTMTKFPLTAPLEARFGALATEGTATGVLRAEYAWADDQRRLVRLATEQVTLERDGAVNEGILSASLTPTSAQLSARLDAEGAIDIDAILSPTLLNLQTTVDDASLTPLLGLIPVLQNLEAQATGTLRGEISGALDALEGRIDGANLDVSLAGIRYQIIDGAGIADRDTVQFSGQVQGTFPVGGTASVRGEVRLQAGVQPLRDGYVEIQGDLELPLVGALQAAQGIVRLRAGTPPELTIDGVLGGPVRFEGTVWPFDVRAYGENVTLAIPGAFIETATGPADVRLYYDQMLVLTGVFAAREGTLTLDRGQPGEGHGEADAWWQRLRYDDLTLTAERMNVDTSFAEGVMAVDLSLGGVASAPTLDGVATVLRGNLNLSGREFQIREGALRFDPTRGVYPRVQLNAVTTYDKQEVLSGAAIAAAFPQPAGPTFDVTLSMDAVATPSTEAGTGFELDVDPVLASEALLALPATESRPAVLRPLTAAELTSLVTLRQLDISGSVLGGNAAGGVAGSAIDTAVQGLLLREVQDAFAQALGLDVVEIRTPSISSVLRGDEDTFGVAVRLGAYVSEGVFASYEIGSAGESNSATGIRNELALSYQVGPVGFDVTTRLDVGADPMEANNRLEASLQYSITPFAAIEAGASVGSNEGEARFGVTLRW